MTDRLCPSCGKPALSVATRCPRCGCAFDARYDREIDPKPYRTRVPGPLLIVVAIVAVAAANMLWKSGRGAPRGVVSAPQTENPSAQPEPTRRSPPRLAVAESSAALKPAKIVAPPPRTDSVVTPKPVTSAVSRVPAPALSSGVERRFATTWINVRAIRSNKAKVVRVLRPGEAVQVDSLREGWYRVVSGETGYADRRLLATAPPSSGP